MWPREAVEAVASLLTSNSQLKEDDASLAPCFAQMHALAVDVTRAFCARAGRLSCHTRAFQLLEAFSRLWKRKGSDILAERNRYEKGCRVLAEMLAKCKLCKLISTSSSQNSRRRPKRLNSCADSQ